MKRVLLVAYYFPPLGLAGVNRPLQLFRYLPEHGWEPHLLTVKPVAYAAYEPELLEGLDVSRIHRSEDYWLRRAFSPAARIFPMAAWRERLRKSPAGSKLFSFLNTGQSDEPFPDPLFQWKPHALRLGRELIRQYQYDLILSTSPPITSHLVAQELHQESGIPWVADFRDYWGPVPIDKQFASEHRRTQARQLVDTIAKHAKSRVAINKRIGDAVAATHIIPNGYDVQFAQAWKPPIADGSVRIGVLGNMTPLSWAPLIKMLIAFRKADTTTPLEVIHVGDDHFRSGLRAFSDSLPGIVFIQHGRQSRSRTVELLNVTQLLYIGFESGSGDHYLPTRLFDLLGAGRQIIAASGEQSELREFVKHVLYVRWYDANSPEAGAALLAEFIRIHTKIPDQATAFAIRRAESAPFASDAMARGFAAMFDEIVL